MAKAKLKKTAGQGGGKGAPPSAEEAPANLNRADSPDKDTANLTFTIPKSERDALKIYAIQQGKTMLQIVREGVELHRKHYE